MHLFSMEALVRTRPVRYLVVSPAKYFCSVDLLTSSHNINLILSCSDRLRPFHILLLSLLTRNFLSSLPLRWMLDVSDHWYRGFPITCTYPPLQSDQVFPYRHSCCLLYQLSWPIFVFVVFRSDFIYLILLSMPWTCVQMFPWLLPRRTVSDVFYLYSVHRTNELKS